MQKLHQDEAGCEQRLLGLNKLARQGPVGCSPKPSKWRCKLTSGRLKASATSRGMPWSFAIATPES